MFQAESGNVFMNTFMHKRQSPDSDGAGDGDGDGGAGAGTGDGAGLGDGGARKKKQPAKVLMCINGDPAVLPIKFNTMTGLRIRDPQAQQDGVVEITNLPNYQMPWMAFLPTSDMWNEQQELMMAQEKVIETNMTMAPPPK